MLNPNASAFAYAYNDVSCPLSNALTRLTNVGLPDKDIGKIEPILKEWFSSSTLDSILLKWENHSNASKLLMVSQNSPMNFLLYNVQGLRAKGSEVIEFIYRYEAAFIICTEVGELWYQQKIPDFNMFHERGTNKNGGVVIGVGKHLQASKVDTNIENTLVIDLFGLNEPLRVIGIY